MVKGRSALVLTGDILAIASLAAVILVFATIPTRTRLTAMTWITARAS